MKPVLNRSGLFCVKLRFVDLLTPSGNHLSKNFFLFRSKIQSLLSTFGRGLHFGHPVGFISFICVCVSLLHKILTNIRDFQIKVRAFQLLKLNTWIVLQESFFLVLKIRNKQQLIYFNCIIRSRVSLIKIFRRLFRRLAQSS